jgi:regulation of enolase protein 1 (concanavalin A-like superfamily)
MDLTSPVEGFAWLNAPVASSFGADGLRITTGRDTDFWQRTHYGFRRDDGHFYYTTSAEDFCCTARLQFSSTTQYEQCGLMVRVDAENWIKCSIEYESPTLSRLGSVITNLGYSDWATQDIASDVGEMHYRIQRHGADFLLEYAFDGRRFSQMRMAHLHKGEGLVMVGVYACSPKSDRFECVVKRLSLSKSRWPNP